MNVGKIKIIVIRRELQTTDLYLTLLLADYELDVEDVYGGSDSSSS
jgi:hypothetical protein